MSIINWVKKALHYAEYLLVIFLVVGVFVSWSTTINQFLKFYQIEGTVFKIKDCAIPNPVTTPCFWGSLAFMASLIWSIKVFLLKVKDKLKNIKYMRLFLLGSMIFAWTNFTIEYRQFVLSSAQKATTCSGVVDSPFQSACFYGSLLFTLSFMTVFFIYLLSNKKS